MSGEKLEGKGKDNEKHSGRGKYLYNREYIRDISGKDSVSLCKLSPFFCLFIKIISEINILLYDGSLSKILTLFQSKL